MVSLSVLATRYESSKREDHDRPTGERTRVSHLAQQLYFICVVVVIK